LISNNPSYWEGENCADSGSSDLWGEKKVYIDDINDYNIKGNVCVDDYNSFWINGIQVNVLKNGSAGCTGWQDASAFFQTGWNTIKFKAVDTCSDNRYMDIDWEVTPRAPALNGIATPGFESSSISLSWSDRGADTYWLPGFESSSISLSWSDRGADTYWLRRYNPDSTITNINVGSVTTYDDDDEGVGLEANTLYSYKVRAIKNGYDSEWSNTVSATTWNQLPVANAGSNQFVVIGNSVNLDGRQRKRS
jgi:hypothetical protein